jgi:hypothetical protein
MPYAVEASRFASAGYNPQQIQSYYQSISQSKVGQETPDNVVQMPQQRQQVTR